MSDGDFEEIFNEVGSGVIEYGIYMLPKGTMSTKMYIKLHNHFKCWEEFVADEMIGTMGETDLEPLEWTTRWHYCFSKLNGAEHDNN